MTVYVAEILGRGIVAFDAANDDEAKAQLADREFMGDLYVLQNEGRPLWDGVSEIHLRGASPNEVETWQASPAMAGQSDEPVDCTGRRVFLITVVDPSIDRFEDDDDHDGDDPGD